MRGKNRYTALKVLFCVLGGLIGWCAGTIIGFLTVTGAVDWVLGDRRIAGGAVILLVLGIVVPVVGAGVVGACLGVWTMLGLARRLGN